MDTRRTQLAAPHDGTPGMNWAFDWGRQQLAVVAEGASTVYRGFEAIRQVQQQTAHGAARRHAEAAERLRGASAPIEVLAVQSQLLRDDFEDASRYWQLLAATTFEMNSRLLGCATHLVGTEDLFAATRLLHA